MRVKGPENILGFLLVRDLSVSDCRGPRETEAGSCIVHDSCLEKILEL